MDRTMKRFLKIYPWYSGLTADLLFYIAIDTLFLSLVKNLSTVQIVSLTTVSTIACIILQFPLLGVIRKLGNTRSVRLGAVLMLLSALCFTFGGNYYWIVCGKLLHDMSAIFRSTLFITLENNLELIDKRQDYVLMRTKANTVYAVITMAISFVASLMFNLHPYFPMACCIAVCVVSCVLSYSIADYSSYDKISRKKKARTKITYSKFIVLTICVYGIFFALITCGQPDEKLFIQQELLLDFDVDNTSLIIGAIVCVSRVVRVLSNMAFHRIYRSQKEKVGIYLPVLLFCSVALVILGSLIPVTFLKVLVMGLGYLLLLFIRDPFRLFVQDAVLIRTAKEDHQTILTIMEFSIRICRAAMSLTFTAILLKFPLIVEMGLMAVIAVVEIALCVKLYKIIIAAKENCETAQA